MKALLLLLLLPSVSFAWIGENSKAQVLNYLQWGAKWEVGQGFQQQLYYGMKPDVAKRNKVETVKSYHVTKHGKKKFWYERTFDSAGRLIRMKTKSDEVEFKFTDTLLTEIQRTTNRTAITTKIGYDNQSRIVKIAFYKNQKLTAETSYAYFEDQKTSLVEKKVFGKKTKIYRLETDYDRVLKRASETRYLVDGELEKRWIYSCDEKGKLENTKVEEVTQCSYTASNNDGSYIVFTRSIEDRKDYLQESTFSKDSVIIEYKGFLHDSILVSHSTFSKELDTYESFKKNGKHRSRSIQEKDQQGNITKYVYYQGNKKKGFTTTSLFAENNLIQQVTHHDGRKVEFEYGYW